MRESIKNIIWILLLLTIFHSCDCKSDAAQANSDTAKFEKTADLTYNNSFDTLAVAQGDLNSDNFSDFAVILQKIGEDTIFNAPSKRPIQIFLGNKDHSYSLFCHSENVVMTHDMGGASTLEPFSDLKIEKEVLTIVHHGGMGSFHWTETVNFKYSSKHKTFCLNQIEIEEGKFSDDPSEAFEKTTIKTVKDFGLLIFDKYDVFKNEE